MRLFALSIGFLLLAGTGEAGSLPVIETHDLDNLSMKAAGKTPSGKWKPIAVEEMNTISASPALAVAGEAPNGDWKKIKTDKDGYVIPSPCYQRMREAMQAMDEKFTRRSVKDERFLYTVITHEECQQWDAVMKECVR